MTEAKQDKLSVTKEILLSLIAGTSITILLSALRATGVLPDLTDALLRPGPLLARKLRATGIASVAFDGVVYGVLPFLAMRLQSRNRGSQIATPQSERRRSHRVLLSAPVFVYGMLKDEPFSEATETLNISASGGLLPLSVRVNPSQKLIITNAQTEEDSPCRVARTVKKRYGKTVAGVEFLHPRANFWQVEFVPSSVEPRS